MKPINLRQELLNVIPKVREDLISLENSLKWEAGELEIDETIWEKLQEMRLLLLERKEMQWRVNFIADFEKTLHGVALEDPMYNDLRGLLNQLKTLWL